MSDLRKFFERCEANVWRELEKTLEEGVDGYLELKNQIGADSIFELVKKMSSSICEDSQAFEEWYEEWGKNEYASAEEAMRFAFGCGATHGRMMQRHHVMLKLEKFLR